MSFYRFFFISILAVLSVSCSRDRDYLSPGQMADGGKVIYIALNGVPEVAVISKSGFKKAGRIRLEGKPNAILYDHDKLYVARGGNPGFIDVLSCRSHKKIRSIKVGHTPVSIARNGEKLYVANRFTNNISVIDCKDFSTRTIDVAREPKSMAITPDGKFLLVVNSLPYSPATDAYITTLISVIDTGNDRLLKNISMGKGVQGAEDIALSPDGRYAYITHIVSRYEIPITQLDRGWVNSNGFSVIDVKNLSLKATLLIDDVDHGAANPHGIDADENRICIAVSGTHELLEIDRKGMHAKIDSIADGRHVSGNNKDFRGCTTSSVFFVKGSSSEDGNNIKNIKDIGSSLSFLSGLKKRYKIPALSPQDILIDGKNVYTTCRFTPSVEKFSRESFESLLLADEKMDSRRRGELAFCNASICYQGWQSCASCHPEGRADALNWDQMNDGMGNPKNTKSMLFSHATPPSMATGIRESAELAVRKGIVHTLGTVQSEETAEDIDCYLKSLKPVESPWLVNGKLSEKAAKGRKVFEKARCSSCHNGKYMTDRKKYDIGLKGRNGEAVLLDTPTLREIWRTAPYFHDGRAVTIMEVLTDSITMEKHGKTNGLTPEELEQLKEYILSL